MLDQLPQTSNQPQPNIFVTPDAGSISGQFNRYHLQQVNIPRRLNMSNPSYVTGSQQHTVAYYGVAYYGNATAIPKSELRISYGRKETSLLKVLHALKKEALDQLEQSNDPNLAKQLFKKLMIVDNEYMYIKIDLIKALMSKIVLSRQEEKYFLKHLESIQQAIIGTKNSNSNLSGYFGLDFVVTRLYFVLSHGDADPIEKYNYISKAKILYSDIKIQYKDTLSEKRLKSIEEYLMISESKRDYLFKEIYDKKVSLAIANIRSNPEYIKKIYKDILDEDNNFYMVDSIMKMTELMLKHDIIDKQECESTIAYLKSDSLIRHDLSIAGSEPRKKYLVARLSWLVEMQ